MSVQEYYEGLKEEYGDTEAVYGVAMDFKEWLVENKYMEGDE